MGDNVRGETKIRPVHPQVFADEDAILQMGFVLSPRGVKSLYFSYDDFPDAVMQFPYGQIKNLQVAIKAIVTNIQRVQSEIDRDDSVMPVSPTNHQPALGLETQSCFFVRFKTRKNTRENELKKFLCNRAKKK